MVGEAGPSRASSDQQYASISFSRVKSVKKALELNGTDLHGMKIRVSCFKNPLFSVLKLIYV